MEIAYSFCSPQISGNICSFSPLGSHWTGPKLTSIHSQLCKTLLPHGRQLLSFPLNQLWEYRLPHAAAYFFHLFIYSLSFKWESDNSPCVLCRPVEIHIIRLEMNGGVFHLYKLGEHRLHSTALFRENLFPKSSDSRCFYALSINKKS